MPKDFWKYLILGTSFNEAEYKDLIKRHYGYYLNDFDVYFDNIIRLNYVNLPNQRYRM